MAKANKISSMVESIDRVDGNMIIRLKGDVTLQRSPELRGQLAKLLDEKPDRLVIDLSRVNYMDSSGVATLVEALQRARKTKTPLPLLSMTSRVKSVFEIARLDTIFSIVDSEAEALKT